MTIFTKKLYLPYGLIVGLYGVFLLFAFLLDTPAEIAGGLWRIITSRSILITDYIALGGIGATLVNSVIVGGFAIFLLVRSKISPNGAIIMAILMSTGFAFFGKNVFNMFPITFGVWLFAKIQKEPFMNYSLVALLSATLSPVVSELSFMNAFPFPIGILVGVGMGILIGMIFPPISAATVNVHGGFCLYNMGFSGGLIATFVVSIMKSLGVVIQTETIWNTQNNLILAIFLYIIALFFILCGVLLGDCSKMMTDMKKIIRHPGRLVTDYYMLYGSSAYVNMGLLCALGTTILLILGGNLNGPTIGGILTLTGFGCFGKHFKNVTPVIIGAVLSTYFNYWDPTSPTNTLAILFSTGLAPIAGQFGWVWGLVAGFLHVNIASFVGQLNSGLNLYNNGFAAGIVAMFLVPLIMAFRKDSEDEV